MCVYVYMYLKEPIHEPGIPRRSVDRDWRQHNILESFDITISISISMCVCVSWRMLFLGWACPCVRTKSHDGNRGIYNLFLAWREKDCDQLWGWLRARHSGCEFICDCACDFTTRDGNGRHGSFASPCNIVAAMARQANGESNHPFLNLDRIDRSMIDRSSIHPMYSCQWSIDRSIDR